MAAMFKIGVVVETPINIDGIKRGIRQRYAKYAQRMFDRVVALSPVETGSFRASWRVAVNGIDESVTYGGVAGAPLPPPAFPGLSARFKLGDTIVISNSMPYALRLENGWSKQAPLGIVKIAMMDIKP